jgi:hypothetical protein
MFTVSAKSGRIGQSRAPRHRNSRREGMIGLYVDSNMHVAVDTMRAFAPA